MIKLKVFLCILLVLSSIGCVACANEESKEPAQKTESVAIYEDLSEFLNDEQIEIFKLAQHIYPQHISGITEHNYGWYILSLDEPECYYFSIYDDNEESYHKNDSLSFPYFNEEHITQAFGESKAFRLFWNGAILEVEYYIEDGTRYFDICSVEYGGTRLDLSSHPISNFRYSVRGYETEQGFVFSSDEDISKTWIFTNEGIIEVATDNIGDMSIPGWYNLPVYQFYKKGDGSLGYTRRPHKALKSQDIVSQLQYIVAEDEIGMEKGFATVQNGELLFHPERTYTISELYDLEKLFSDWIEYASTLSDEALESYGIFSKVKSLEELLQYNAAHYESISNGEVNNNTNTDYVGSETEITEKKSLVFSISQGLKNYGIILDSQYLTDDIQGEKSNYYEFVSLGDFPSINSIELKALYHCTEENIQTQSDYILLNYQSFATIFFRESFSYSNNNTLMTYAIQDNETSKYCFVCLLYDIENNMLCEFILEVGDIEAFRVNSSNNTVKEMFENVYITEAPSP